MIINHFNESLLLRRVIHICSNNLELKEVMRHIINSILEILQFDAGGIYLYDEKLENITLEYQHGFDLNLVKQLEEIYSYHFLKIFQLDKRCITTEDFKEFDDFLFENTCFSSIIVIPLIAEEDLIGSINIASKSQSVFSEEEKSTFCSLGQIIGLSVSDLQSKLKLKESEEKYRIMIKNLEDTIVVFNDRFEFEYVNGRDFTEVMGYSKNDLLGTNSINYVHSDDLPRILELTKKAFDEDITFQLRLKSKKGEYVWHEAKGGAFINHQGEKKLIGLYRNIQDRKNMELELIKMSQMKSELLNRVSHELNTPLVSILGAADLILDNFGDEIDDHVLKYIKLIKDGGLALKELVTNLLDVSKLKSLHYEINLDDYNLRNLIKECINQLKILINKRKLIIDVSELPDCQIRIDGPKFKHVIDNLLTNAVKNTPSNGVISFKIIDDRPNSFDLIVQDTGVGLTNEEMTTIFKKFGKIERYGQGLDIISDGTGLGLFICKELVELHGGKIWAESEGRNKGTKFIIRLFNHSS